MSYALTACFLVWQPPNTPFILSCQPMAPVYHVDAEEDAKDFRLLRSGLAPSEIVVFFLCPERAFHYSLYQSGKFHHYVVQQLVVRKWPCRIYYHVAEYLVMDVAVQLFQQFRTAESSVYLQEHQGHFPFKCEKGLSSQLRSHAFPYKTEVLRHLVEREQLLYSAQFALFGRRIVELVKIELRKRNVWRYFRKISYF